MNKIINPGVGKYGRVYCKIKYDGKSLSISGVEGPKANGNCRGSCGQIQDELLTSLTSLSSRTCEVCRYKFGTEWRHKDVPKEVLDFLEALPETTTKPAWV